MRFFNQIAKSCPKGFEEWDKFIYLQNADGLLPMEFDLINWDELEWPSLWGWIIEFAVEKGVWGEVTKNVFAHDLGYLDWQEAIAKRIFRELEEQL